MEYVCDVCQDRIYPNARGQVRLEGPVATMTNVDHAIDSQLVQRTVLTNELLIAGKGVYDRAARCGRGYRLVARL